MKKAFGQTVRDLKREVNKTVLKVPRIEQKILDATSNEPWGPHGSYLAEIAQATKSFNEYQIIMSVIWKRINDTGKNWRHVYKGLTVLEYLVAHGSERVIDEIREHAYQISTLSDFQYIDSRGKDQGNNVRRKSQSLVTLVNDKERIQEVRQKAFANKDKYQSSFSTGGMRRSGSGGGFGDRYDDDRYENRYRDDDQNGYPRDRDEDRYGRGRDSYSNDGERYGWDSDRNGRDGYRDDDRQGRTRDGDFQFGSRSRSVDRYRGRSFDDDDQYSSRSGGGRADDASHDERQSGSKPPEQSAAAPPSYEEAVKSPEGHITEERDEKASVTSNESTVKVAAPPPKVNPPVETTSRPTTTSIAMPANGTEADGFDEFDPRGFAPAPAAAKSVEMDLFGSFSAEDSLNSLALVPVTSDMTTSETDVSSTSGFSGSFVAMPSATSALDQPSNNPFGDTPFKAIPPNGFSDQPQSAPSFVSSQPDLASANSSGIQPTVAPKVETSSGFDFGDSFYGLDASSSFQQSPAAPATTTTPSVSNDLESMFGMSNMTAESFPSQFTSGVPPVRSQTAPPELLGQSLPQAPQSASPNPFGQPVMSSQVPPSYPSAQPGLLTQMSQPGLPPQMSQPGLPPQMVQPGIQTQMAQPGLSTQLIQPGQPSQMALPGQQSQMIPQNQFARPGLPSAASAPNLLGQSLMMTPSASQVATSTTSGLPPKAMQPKDKFETKSTVWADTLSRGLVNLNISGPKTNPLADIGVDFESINRKDKMKAKDQNATPISSITMGKAMGSGSGIGRSGSSAIGPPVNSMMNPGMGTGGSGMGGYGGGMNPNMGMGGGYAGGMNQSMGMGAIRPGPGMPQGPGMPGGGYNPMMNMGGYGSQQPYGGGYR